MSGFVLPPAPRLALLAVTAALSLAGAPAVAWSQAVPPQQPGPKTVIIQVAPAPDPAPPALAPAPAVAPPAAPAAPPERENPGLINEIGKLFKDSGSLLPSWDGLGKVDGLTRMNTVVKGRMVCPVAANGAPDCKSASDRLCQSKGYKEGKSLDTDAAQTCSAKVMIPGRKQEEGDCRTENFVTQALCQ